MGLGAGVGGGGVGDGAGGGVTGEEFGAVAAVAAVGDGLSVSSPLMPRHPAMNTLKAINDQTARLRIRARLAISSDLEAHQVCEVGQC